MMSNQKSKIKNQKSPGFTLLEIMVAMLLVSMVTLIVSMAFRLALGAWERAEKEGDGGQILVAIPSLMEKHTACVVKDSPFSPQGRNQLLPFCGLENGFSLFTSYAPQGSPYQGLLRVSYVYEPDGKTLSIYQQVITRIEDLRDELNPFSDRWDEKTLPASRIPGVSHFSVRYSGYKKYDPEKEDHWKDTWPCGSAIPLFGLRIEIGLESDRRELPRTWYFRIGPPGP